MLLSLVEGEKHGYLIMGEAAARTGGRVSLGAGTLYQALKRMVAAGLIEEVSSRDGTLGDVGVGGGGEKRRRYYRATDLGRDALLSEVDRMRLYVEAAAGIGHDGTQGEAGGGSWTKRR